MVAQRSGRSSYVRALRVAMLGTRGVPARYGGFETAVEEIGQRLAARGHAVTVYRRASKGEGAHPTEHLGMQLVTLPAVWVKVGETLSHSAASTAHAIARHRPDVVLLFNAANAVFLPFLRARHVPTALHADGLEWKRAKWSGTGQRYYRSVESLAVRWADAIIADAPGIARYYRDEFGASTEQLSYGAPVLDHVGVDRLDELGVAAGAFHLVVARFEPENHVEQIVAGYRASTAQHPLVVVGAAPYSDEYTARVEAAAGGDARIRFVGAVWDQAQLDQLYAGALLYLHGHSVGGTNPSLLRAMGAGAAVAAYDVDFNRDVLGIAHEPSRYFHDEVTVARAVESAERDPGACREYGSALRARAAEQFRWDDVTDGYEELVRRLASGWSRRGEATGKRLRRAARVSSDAR